MAKTSAIRMKQMARPERVSIRIESSQGQEMMELPFVAMAVDNYAGDNEEQANIPLEKRATHEVTAETFDKYMGQIKPELRFTAANKMTGQGQLGVDLRFETMEDFKPDKVAEQLPVVKDLLQQRKLLQRLKDRAQLEPIRAALNQYMSDADFMGALQERAKPREGEA